MFSMHGSDDEACIEGFLFFSLHKLVFKTISITNQTLISGFIYTYVYMKYNYIYYTVCMCFLTFEE